MIKRIYISFVLVTAMMSMLRTPHCHGQGLANDIIKEDSMNLAILVLDFLTYEFIEGNMAYYPLCDSCDTDSLPFIIEFMYPLDYGEILYNYSHNEDTLFYGSIWWAGVGQIKLPSDFMPSNTFAYQPESIMLPNHTQYYDYWLISNGMSSEQYMEKADSAWMSIDSLLIVNEFSDYTFRVGLYAYTPSVGMFDPSVAKWIIFLYYGNTFTTSITDTKLKSTNIKSYPNPFTTSTTIESNLKGISNIQFTVYNIQGMVVYETEERLVKPGLHKVNWSPPHLPGGMYYGVLRSFPPTPRLRGTQAGVSVVKIIKQ